LEPFYRQISFPDRFVFVEVVINTNKADFYLIRPGHNIVFICQIHIRQYAVVLKILQISENKGKVKQINIEGIPVNRIPKIYITESKDKSKETNQYWYTPVNHHYV